MLGRSLTGFSRSGLRIALGLFFLALAVPTAVLVRYAYGQLKWEAFHQHRVLAEELVSRIDAGLVNAVAREEARSFSDYAFLVVAGDPSANFLQRSVLSAYPVATTVPGLIGYFQIDEGGGFSTPLLPSPSTNVDSYGISASERSGRLAQQELLYSILSDNRLVHAQATPQTQAAFDQLKSAAPVRDKKVQQRQAVKVDDLELDAAYEVQIADLADESMEAANLYRVEPEASAQPSERRARKEQSALPEALSVSPSSAAASDETGLRGLRISTFESEIEPFEFSLLESGHLALFRRVWRDGQRYIQGALIDGQPFFGEVIESTFRNTALSQMSNLVVAHRGNVLTAFSGSSSRRYLSRAEELSGALLYRSRLSAPLDDIELILSVTQLPTGPGRGVIIWVSAILALVLSVGVGLMYRLGARQIDLARQQQDFVSAVSHELKTPLTSIRMYGEMLREGWATEERKMTYYDYIFHESERLSRLISNVLPTGPHDSQ